jgi:hypothetical protein
MQRTTNRIRAALLLTLTLLTAGCGVRNARETAIRIAANTLRQSVFCLQSAVPLTQSTFKGAAPAVRPEPATVTATAAPGAQRFDYTATQHNDLRIEGPDELRTVTCPIERHRLLSRTLLRTL